LKKQFLVLLTDVQCLFGQTNVLMNQNCAIKSS